MRRAPALTHPLHVEADPILGPRGLVLDDDASDLHAGDLGVHGQGRADLLLGGGGVREVTGRRRLRRRASAPLGRLERGPNFGRVVVGRERQIRLEGERVGKRLRRRGLVAVAKLHDPEVAEQHRAGRRRAADVAACPRGPPENPDARRIVGGEILLGGSLESDPGRRLGSRVEGAGGRRRRHRREQGRARPT